MSDDGVVLGEIKMTPAPDEGPLFRIIARGHLSMARYAEPDLVNAVRPCAHGSYILDEEWRTVTCGECKEKVDAFAALMKYAEWWNRLQRRRLDAEHAEWSLLGKGVREMLKRREFTAEEREAIGRRTYSYGNDSLKDIQKLHAEICGRVQATKAARRISPTH